MQRAGLARSVPSVYVTLFQYSHRRAHLSPRTKGPRPSLINPRTHDITGSVRIAFRRCPGASCSSRLILRYCIPRARTTESTRAHRHRGGLEDYLEGFPS